jgi:hypothetical protein
MYKFLFSLVLFFQAICAAAQTPINTLDDLKQPTVIAERPGVYRFQLSMDMAKRTLDSLQSIFAPSTREVDEFKGLLHHMIYPHPSKVSGVRQLWKDFASAIQDFRLMFNIRDEALPHYSSSQYADLPTSKAAISGFCAYVKQSIDSERTPMDMHSMYEIIDLKGKEIEKKLKSTLMIMLLFIKLARRLSESMI